MKPSARAIRRPNDGHAATEHPRNELVIPLPDPRLLRLIARSVFLAAAVISLPWLRSMLFSGLVSETAIPVSNSPEDELFYIPKLLEDMKAHGLIQPQGRSLFLGDPGLHAALLWRNGISFCPENKIWQITQGQSLDFVFLSAGGISDAHFRLIDNSMRVGGVVAFRLAPHPAKPFNLPANYRMIYIQNIGLTIIAVKKLYQENDGGGQPERLLLSVSATKEHALRVQAMEDAALEKPVVKKHLKKLLNLYAVVRRRPNMKKI